jgi:anaphase-promoting complex subunit 3
MHAPDNPHVAVQLRNLIYYSLDNDLLQTALFHAGRLHGIDNRSGDAAHLMALCHFRMGQYKAAFDYSREKGLRGLHLGCSYIYAQCCLALQRYVDGITALERSRNLWMTRNHWSPSESSLFALTY